MPPSRPRLLVVDDDRFILASLVPGLARAGFDVVVATTGAEAIRLAREEPPAMALIDADMDGRAEFEVAQAFSRPPRLPFFFLAGARDLSIGSRAAGLGAAGVLAKPADLTRIVPAVRSAIARSTAGLGEQGGTVAAKEGQALGHAPESLVAVGILVERHKVNCDEALRMLEARARESGRLVEEAALDVIEQAEGAASAG